jgi:5-oxoprolinase (ATP-hydrolysing)
MEPDKRITKFRFNIDRGGTFTDIYCEYYPEGKFKTDSKCLVYKLLSQDPFNYDDAPSEGIRRLISQVTGLKIH